MWDISTTLHYSSPTLGTLDDRPNPQQSNTQHARRQSQPCSDTTSQAQPIFLLKTQVLRRGEHDPYRQYRGAITDRCETFQQRERKR